MAKITLIHGDNNDVAFPATDMIFTDPPFELSGAELAKTLGRIQSNHLVLITTMSQLLGFVQSAPEWKLNFDFVLDGVAPKNSKSRQQPNYLHQTGVYMTKERAKTCFSRFARPRSDVAEANGYWPTIFRAPRINRNIFGMGKNPDAMTDLLGSFDVKSVIDPYAGFGSTGIAALELDMECLLVERDIETFEVMRNNLRFLASYDSIIEATS